MQLYMTWISLLVTNGYKGDTYMDAWYNRFTTTKMLICPGWETPFVPVSQPGTPVRDKRGALLSRVWQPGQKRTFCPGW